MEGDISNYFEILEKLFQKYRSESWTITGDEVRNKIKNSDPGWIISGTRWNSVKGLSESWEFGLIGGVIITKDEVFILRDYRYYHSDDIFSFYFLNRNSLDNLDDFLDGGIGSGSTRGNPIKLSSPEINFIKEFIENCKQYEIDFKNEQLEETNENLKKHLEYFDKDNNGQLDFIEGGDDYLSLLKKHQSKIVEIDRTYIQQFVKVSNYLTQKKQNLQVIFEKLIESEKPNQLENLVDILKQEIHSYNLILLNSLNMVNSLVEDDMITFYDIYEKFDKLNMFTSNWENQVTEKLDEVNLNLVELMKEVRDVGDIIVGSIDNLSYINEQSTRQLTSKMEEIDSTLKVGNLINVIQSYQMYKVNKNTKSLRG
tara:strand:+ start:434 stop:1543 length:1110 start_codon:yes stop_codon:yes gene_type:complete